MKFLGSCMLLLPLLTCVSVAADERSAIVTFYSHGSLLKSGIPGTKQDIYIGGIFDGQEYLFHFLDSFWEHNDRAITMRLAPGEHTFGASNGKEPQARETLTLVLKAGEHVFIRAQGESKGVPGVFAIQHGRLDLVPCSRAMEELTKAKLLGPKNLAKKLRPQAASLIVDETLPAPCS